jgi:hypothetical protein
MSRVERRRAVRSLRPGWPAKASPPPVVGRDGSVAPVHVGPWKLTMTTPPHPWVRYPRRVVPAVLPRSGRILSHRIGNPTDRPRHLVSVVEEVCLERTLWILRITWSVASPNKTPSRSLRSVAGACDIPFPKGQPGGGSSRPPESALLAVGQGDLDPGPLDPGVSASGQPEPQRLDLSGLATVQAVAEELDEEAAHEEE